VNKKLMLLVALAKLQKPINWAQVVFNNLHYRLRDLSAKIKPKKTAMGGRRNVVEPKSSISSFNIGFQLTRLSNYQNPKTRMKKRITFQ
jgi:hypothetical protein